MVASLLILLLIQGAGFFWLLDRQAKQAKLALEHTTIALMTQASEENTRLVMLAESALENMKAKSIEEKVRADALKREHDIRLEMYRDAVAKEVAQLKEKKVKENRWVTAENLVSGQTGKMDLNDIELLE